MSAPPMALNINSHHFGFGALNLEKLQKTPGDSRTTHLQPSNKFKTKIALKQRQIEVSTAKTLTYHDIGTYNGKPPAEVANGR